MRDGEPVQVIQPPTTFELPLLDLSGLGDDQRQAAVAAQSWEEAETPFDLTADSMMRANLLRLAESKHILLLTLHHIASDGYSMPILWRELSNLYDAYARNVSQPLPALPVQYVDYAIWQRHELQDQRLAGLTEYWQQQLEDLPVLDLPTDRPRPAQPSYRGAHYDFLLEGRLVGQLQQLSRDAGVTLHMLLLAGFQTLLARYSGQDDIAVGMPTTGRGHVDLEDQIGIFINTLVLRC